MNIVKFIFRSPCCLSRHPSYAHGYRRRLTGALAEDVPLKTKEGLKAALGSPS